MPGKLLVTLAVFSLTLLLGNPRPAAAHCDTLDGPVVQDARAALEKGAVTPTLKWVRPEDEGEIRTAFDQALEVRRLGAAARDLADRFFFETLVRVHRAGEGAPFTGLKPAGEVPKPIALADQSLEKGSVDELVGKIVAHTEEGIRHRFRQTVEARKDAGMSVEAGRRYVHRYVDYIHYIEGVVETVHGEGDGH